MAHFSCLLFYVLLSADGFRRKTDGFAAQYSKRHFCCIFVLTVGYCLLHRPYMYFQYYRYPFHFHTVTISAVYLALAVCAALVKFWMLMDGGLPWRGLIRSFRCLAFPLCICCLPCRAPGIWPFCNSGCGDSGGFLFRKGISASGKTAAFPAGNGADGTFRYHKFSGDVYCPENASRCGGGYQSS